MPHPLLELVIDYKNAEYLLKKQEAIQEEQLRAIKTAIDIILDAVNPHKNPFENFGEDDHDQRITQT